MDQVMYSSDLEQQYKAERADELQKVNRITAPAGLLLVLYLMLFSDPVNFPAYYQQMILGRLYVIILAPLLGVASWVPKLKSRSLIVSTLIFVAAALMMAHLTAVMNNHESSVIAWILVSILFCAIFPIPIAHSAIVVLFSFGYYVLAYFNAGYSADLDFRMVFVNVGSASFLSLAFKLAIQRIRKREFLFRKGLEKANVEIAQLNDKLKDDNLRLAHELQVAQHIQTVVLPDARDYHALDGLDISCAMIPAEEVGGDYYDIIPYDDYGIIAIGDVTDHGLHSGLIMMMVHTALRSLSHVERDNIVNMYRVINRVLVDFRRKTADNRIMTLLILRYLGDGSFIMTGQHESLIILRAEGDVEEISSIDFGMYAGLDDEIDDFLGTRELRLATGDTLLLYTDGITEAVNGNNREFGLDGLIDAAKRNRNGSAEDMRNRILESCFAHMGDERIYDDISIMVVKKD